MNTQIVITPQGILIVLLGIAGFVALVLLSICLYKAICILGKVNKLVSENSKPITESIQKFPEITEDASIICRNMADVTESAADILDGVDNVIGGSAVGEGGIMGVVSFVANLVQSIIQIFRKFTSD